MEESFNTFEEEITQRLQMKTEEKKSFKIQTNFFPFFVGGETFGFPPQRL